MTNSMLPSQTIPEPLLQRIREARIIAVVVIDDPADAVPLAESLIAGGIQAIELTLRTSTAFESLRRIREACPSMLAGLGTVLFPEQVTAAVEGGAAFAVAPGLNPDVVRAAQAAGLPFGPGIVTPSDIEGAVRLGSRLLKLFPAEPCGGVAFLKSISAPYAHLGLEYIPLGGLNEHNFTGYLALKNVPAVGGSWIAPRELIQAKDWKAIRENASRALAKTK
ncbi:MAG: bifunctional 4-hydroxy-2-oxoglutarate aldolase/2-dehydro-3-deoxy-phosphogluconate aldolase [Spartobacteria bacterium]